MAQVIIYTMNDGTYQLSYPALGLTKPAKETITFYTSRLVNGEVVRETRETEVVSQVAVSADEIAQNGIPANATSYVIGDDTALPAAVQNWLSQQATVSSRATLTEAARVALDAADTSCRRTIFAGQSVNAAWLAYLAALRAIIGGVDTTSTVLPTKPAYQV